LVAVAAVLLLPVEALAVVVKPPEAMAALRAHRGKVMLVARELTAAQHLTQVVVAVARVLQVAAEEEIPQVAAA
jgi:hypothetical protein